MDWETAPTSRGGRIWHLLYECFALCHRFRVKNCPQRCVGFFSGAGSIRKVLDSDAQVSLGFTPGFLAEEDSVIARLTQAGHHHIRLFQLQVGKPCIVRSVVV